VAMKLMMDDEEILRLGLKVAEIFGERNRAWDEWTEDSKALTYKSLTFSTTIRPRTLRKAPSCLCWRGYGPMTMA